jgi:uncharacterized membrane protein YeaQ/YmgE (transglycosylase-associated protein family)
MKGAIAFLGVILSSWLLMNLLGALVIGAIARFLLPGKDKVGWFTTICVGFLGGIAANIVAHLAGWVPWGKNTGILGSLLGAMGLLLLHRIWAMNRKDRHSPPSSAA